MATHDPGKAVVRAATEADLDTLRTFPDAAKLDETMAAADADEALLAVVEAGGQVVGSAMLDLVSKLSPEVKRIWVPQEHRRHGYGSMVVRWLEDHARSHGHDACFMAIDPNNAKAIPMAIELGYSATGDHLFVETPDEVHHRDTTGSTNGAEGEQTPDDAGAGHHYAIYRKSLTMA